MSSLISADKRTKYLVSRYIREQHKTLFNSNTSVLFQNIPIAISSLCIVYFFLMDYFEMADDQKAVISKDMRTITQQQDCGGIRTTSVFGLLTIPSMDKEYIYKWNIKINKSINDDMFIGISSAPFKTDRNFYFCTTSYAYGSNGAVSECINGSQEFLRAAGTKGNLMDDDTVNICLDLKHEKFSFRRNGQDEILWEFDIEIDRDIEYKLARGMNICMTVY